MARELDGTVLLQILLEERLTGRGSGQSPTRQRHDWTVSQNYGTGIAAGQLDRPYSVKSGTVDTTGTTIDLSGTSIADVADGSLTVSFAKIKLVMLTNEDATNNLLVFGS